MSRFEQLREELERIKEEAAEREATRRAILLEKERGKEGEQRKEAARQKRIEEEWSEVKINILDILETLNREVLGSKGKVIEWNKERFDHTHKTYVTMPGGGDDYHPDKTWEKETKRRSKGTIEIAQLTINGLGRIFLFRRLAGESALQSHDSSRGFYFPFSPDGSSDSMFIGSSETMKESVCPECEVVKVSLDNHIGTTEIEKVISEQVISLYKKHSSPK